MAGNEPDHRIERLIFFSDAVIAIAITLLVIEIEIPHLAPTASASDYGFALAELTPKFVGFFVSFFVIGAFWAGHHRTFAFARYWSDGLILPNLLMLFAIAATPFFTAFMSANPNARVPVTLYCIWLFTTALLNIGLQRRVMSAAIVDPDSDETEQKALRRRGLGVALGAMTAIVVALVSPLPLFALFALTTMPLWRVLLDRRARRAERVETDTAADD